MQGNSGLLITQTISLAALLLELAAAKKPPTKNKTPAREPRILERYRMQRHTHWQPGHNGERWGAGAGSDPGSSLAGEKPLRH